MESYDILLSKGYLQLDHYFNIKISTIKLIQDGFEKTKAFCIEIENIDNYASAALEHCAIEHEESSSEDSDSSNSSEKVNEKKNIAPISLGSDLSFNQADKD